jgi:hypothetical protein
VNESTIYLLGADGELVAMTQQAYDSEDLLQRLVATHPTLLGGGASATRWLLIRREMPVPDQQEGTGRWSLDHLFVDDRAVPTLVEVKRATDTRIRREVIGQLLDYAANGVEYWPAGELRRALEATLGSADAAEAAIVELTDMDPDTFWQMAEANLRAGRVRLVVLADAIPKELQRVVEFLNERMPDTEVLALEVQQYLGGGQQTLVPRVVGDTTAAQRVKATGASRDFTEVLAQSSDSVRQLHDRLLSWVEARGGTTSPAPKSVGFRVAGRQVVRLWPIDEVLELSLTDLRRRGLQKEAEQIRAEMRVLFPGHPLSNKHLYLPVDGLLTHWDTFANDTLPRYMSLLDVAPQPLDP